MRRLIRNGLLFLGGVALCFTAASVYYELRVRQSGDFFRQVALFQDPRIQPEVLLIGDSRMALNVDQRLLPPGYFKFSYPGETHRHIYLRLKHALETKPSIRHVVLGLEDVGFSDNRARLRDATRQMLFADLADLTEVYPADLRLLLRHAVLHYVPLVNATQRRLAWDQLVRDADRWLRGAPDVPKQDLVCGNIRPLLAPRWPRLAPRERRQTAHEEVSHLIDGKPDNSEMRKVIYMILELTRRHDVDVIVVRSPLSESYLQAAQAQGTDNAADFLNPDWVSAILDYRYLFSEREELFFDADHLNPTGSVAFTRALLSDLEPHIRLSRDGQTETSGRGCLSEPDLATQPAWPYNDVVSDWLNRRTCRNLTGDCSPLPDHAKRPVSEGLQSGRALQKPIPHES